jgi:hypothetical protein
VWTMQLSCLDAQEFFNKVGLKNYRNHDNEYWTMTN